LCAKQYRTCNRRFSHDRARWSNLKSYGVSEKVSKFWGRLAFYTTFFAIDAASHDDFTNINVVYNAAINTAQLFATNVVIDATEKLLKRSAEVLERNNHRTLGNQLKCCSSLLPFSIFARNAAQNGVASVATAFVAGSAAQLAVERIGMR
jgi:hypothetical protein